MTDEPKNSTSLARRKISTFCYGEEIKRVDSESSMSIEEDSSESQTITRRKISTYSYNESMKDIRPVSQKDRTPQDDEFANIPIPDANDPALFDPYCDPENPIKVRFQDVSTAAYRLKSGIIRTPCEKSRLSQTFGMELYFKKDFQQMTESFKERGARYALLSLNKDQKSRGVIAASAGNHALALAYHGQTLNIPVIVVMPVIAPLMKINSCVTYGARVLVRGSCLNDSKQIAMKIAQLHNLVYINGYDHPDILAGQGSLGLEIMEQVPDVEAVVVPVGGGGMIAGVALACKSLNPAVQIIGVESDRCPGFGNSMKEGKIVFTPSYSTLADGLAVSLVGCNSFITGVEHIDKMVAVSEEFIALSILRLIEVEKAVVEGAGATGFAAILSGQVPELKGKKVVIVLGGGNIDTTVLGRSIERGLAADGRIVRFVCHVTDRPGGIAQLATLMGQMGVSIKDIFHERAWVKADIFSVQVKCVCETRDINHAKELEKVLRENYSAVFWGPQVF